ncbi:MAG: hypothetical protein JWQ19_3516, partial [Subtercola sp.]|nr:hypothetical protein [Subtercola sp.]
MACALVVSGFFLPSGRAAQALPGECTHVVTWENGTTTDEGDDVLVEDGVHATENDVCDFIGPAAPDGPDGGGGGAGGGMPAAPPPAAPPGPVSPPPPASSPASAAPPCVPGSSNAPVPGNSIGNVTGTGETVLDNIETEVAAGDITVDAVPNADDIKGVPGDAVTKSVTLEVNVGAPVN